jgi:protein-tyrosine kinase
VKTANNPAELEIVGRVPASAQRSEPLGGVGAIDIVHNHTVPTVGALLVDMRRITPVQAEEILVLHRQRGERFGRTAVALGYITEADLQVALARQQGVHVLFPHDRAALAPSVRALLEDPLTYTNLQHARAQLQLRWFDDHAEKRTLAVVSNAEGDGRTHFTALMGLLLAQQGLRVLLVDTVMHNPQLAALFGIADSEAPGKRGATLNVADAHAPLDSVDLKVLTMGDTGLGLESLYSQSFSRVLAEAASRFDAVLIDTACCSQHVEAITVATRASAAVSLVRLNHTSARQQANLLRQLREAGVEHLGSIALA